MSDLDTLRDILGQMHVGTRNHADLDWLARNGLHVLDAALHPVSDATPDLALYDLPALASEPVPATGNPTPHEPMWLAQSADDLREIRAAHLSADLEWLAAALVDATEDPNTFQPTEHPDYWRWVAETITTRHDWPGLATGNPEGIDVDALARALHEASPASHFRRKCRDDHYLRAEAIAAEYARQREGERP